MHVEHLIIGAGPAGIQLGLFFKKRQRDFKIIERSDRVGSFFAEYPRHRTLLSINKVYTGYPDRESQLRYDWNSLLVDEDELQFTRYSPHYFPKADVLPRYLDDIVAKHPLPIEHGASVRRIARRGDLYEVSAEDGRVWTCDKLFIATGVFKENLPDIAGISHCESYAHMSVKPEDFTDQRVLIVGKGNSAFETADNLLETSRKIQIVGPSPVKLAWASHYVGHVRAVNNNFLDTYQLKAQNNVLDGSLRRVTRAEDGTLLGEIWFESRKRSYTFVYDRILLCTGFRFDTDMFDDACSPALTACGRLPRMTSEWESEDQPGMFFAGTLMQQRDYKKTMSSFIHGFRYNVRCLDHILDCKYNNAQWRQSQEIRAEPRALASRSIARLSTSSAILLQPGFLADVIGIKNNTAYWVEDVPVDYAHEHVAGRFDECVFVTLEYKVEDGHQDPFAMPRGIGVTEDYYLHPILRRFRRGEEIGRTFLPDDLDNDWRDEAQHISALQEWFASFVGLPEGRASLSRP